LRLQIAAQGANPLNGSVRVILSVLQRDERKWFVVRVATRDGTLPARSVMNKFRNEQVP
jgi:hypothetical protein